MNTETQPKRRGRPAASPEAQRKPRTIRLTDAHWKRLMDLGGYWLEHQLDRAPPGTEWMKELRKR
jgi:hypothetical protein